MSTYFAGFTYTLLIIKEKTINIKVRHVFRPEEPQFDGQQGKVL